MTPSMLEIATPIFSGAGLTMGLALIGLIYVNVRKKRSDQTGFWETVMHARGQAPSFRDKMILSAILLLVAGILLVVLYAWTIGFGSFSGQVANKTVTSVGKYGDYALEVGGKVYRVRLNVYRAAEKGSRVSRPWGRPYVIVDETPYVRVWSLGFFGAIGIILVLLCSVFLLLCWWPCREARQQR